LYVTYLVCKGHFGVQPIYHGLTYKFQAWYYDGKIVYLGNIFEKRSEAEAEAEQLRRNSMLR